VRFFSTFFMGFPLLYDGVLLVVPGAYYVYRSFSGGLFLGAVGRWCKSEKQMRDPSLRSG